MFYIHCPYCDEYRDEEEFAPKGQAHIARPEDPEACTDEQWGAYLFFRDNPRGIHHELWVHAIGCRKFFNITRNSASYAILETYRMGEQPRFSAEHPEGKPAEPVAAVNVADKAGRVAGQEGVKA
jgi:sarcosine oxidase subunit delta